MVHADYVLVRPDASTMLLRGLRRRCPLCGSGSLFDRWIVMVERCPRCDLRFERVEGHWVGSIGLNTIVSLAVLLVVVAGGTALTRPDVPLVPFALFAVTAALVVPLAFHPVARTLWTAIDLAVRPLDVDDLS